MNKSILVICLFSVFCFKALLSQERNGLYLEFGGAGIFYSINYDLRILDQDSGFGLRLGLGIAPIEREMFLLIPIQANYLLGESKHKMEIGLGLTFLFDKDTEDELLDEKYLPSAAIMYRYQPFDSRLIIRAGLSPLLHFFKDEYASEGTINPYLLFFPGVSVGFQF